MVSSLGIVLPAYNEEARLGPALDELFVYLCAEPAGLPANVTVLVVDDGSTDGTAALVRGFSGRLDWSVTLTASMASRCSCPARPG